jgi:hypothetical protein
MRSDSLQRGDRMSSNIQGGDLPGLKALMARMNGANRYVLVGVPSGTTERGQHIRANREYKKAMAVVREFASLAGDAASKGQMRKNLSGVRKEARTLADAKFAGSVSLAMVAAVHEFGSPEQGIPERSFLRGGIRRATPKLNAVNIDSLRKVLLGKMTIEQAVEKLGVVAAGEVKREFVVGTFVPNKPATIARKGSSRPLIDTGSLRQAVTYVVEGASNAR